MKKKKIGLIIILSLIIICLAVYLAHLQLQPQDISEPLVKLYLSNKDQVIELKMEEYLVGTVAAEMPASFDIEALKAQAVCARTYAVRKIITGRTYPKGADLSDDITCCQAYSCEADFREIAPKWQKKIAQAVKATRGEIMLYQDEPIDALYHSTCGGRTETAAEAWIEGCPYLQSIRCRYCQNSSYYTTKHNFSNQYIAQQYGQNSNKNPNIKILERTSSNRVKKLLINGNEISGENLRRTLNLPSSNFTIKNNNHQISIVCHGYGHGVGMCQYGADGMAKSGKDYISILKTYYRGIDIYKMEY